MAPATLMLAQLLQVPPLPPLALWLVAAALCAATLLVWHSLRGQSFRIARDCSGAARKGRVLSAEAPVGACSFVVCEIGGVQTDVLEIRARTPSARGGARLLFFMVPGNPGVCDFYAEFLQHLAHASGGTVDFVCPSHAGHSKRQRNAGKLFSLEDQIAHKVALVEALLTEVHPDTRFVLAGHSVGAHICLELMRRVPALSERCDRALLLFPTIMHIGSTPNGRALRPVFHPLVRHAVAVVAGFLALLPRRFVGPLLAWHVGHEHDGILSGCSLLLSANATHNALFMAYHEMREILALDHSTISRHVDKLLFYFGSGDRWCPPEYAKAIMAAYPRAHAILCSEGIKHAFVLGGAEAMALKAWGWIEALARRRS